jgi:hypothetical protein
MGVLVGNGDNSAHNLWLIDARYSDPTAPEIVFDNDYSPIKDIETGWLLTVNVATSGGQAISGATVQVYNSAETLIYSGTTNAQGQVTGVPIITTMYAQVDTLASKVNVTNYGPFKLVVTSGTSQVTENFSLTANATLQANF